MESNIKLSIKENQIQIMKIDKESQKIIVEDSVSENESQSSKSINKEDKQTENSIVSKLSEDEKEKEFFTESPTKLLLLKIFFLFEGELIRIFVQIGDIYFAAIITNIYLEVVIIQICASAESNTFIQFYAVISSLIFSYLMVSKKF